MKREIGEAVQLALALFFCASVLICVGAASIGLDGDWFFHTALGATFGLIVGTLVTGWLVSKRLDD